MRSYKNHKMILFALSVFHVIAEATSACSSRVASSMCLFTKVLPKEKDRFMPSIGNGYIATIVMSDAIHVAGVYNGVANATNIQKHVLPSKYKTHKTWRNTDVAHRARVPSTAAIGFSQSAVQGVSTYALDVEYGVYYRWFDSKSVHVVQKIYAHRVRENLIVNEISVQTDVDFILYFPTNRGDDSSDITFRKTQMKGVPFNSTVGTINKPEIKFATKVAVVWTHIPKSVRIYKSAGKRTFRFITAISSSLHSPDPLSTCMKSWKEASAEKDLFASHANKWKQLWKSANISLTGSLYLSQLVSTSLYYTLSQVNKRFPHGLSPGGLAGGEEYFGHVFWDQDVWMYPSILMLHPDIGRSLLEYRRKRLNAAKQIAIKYNYKGAMYPWESGLSGYEVCPAHVYGLHEIHINGDIAFAQRQYYFATGDLKWLEEKAYDVIFQTAKFWASRVTYDPHADRYVINDVMPPDEYAYPVNNSIYTNTIAKLNLEIAMEFGRLLNVTTPRKWKEIALKLYLPFDKTLQYHPEYEHFDISKDTVKQADTILINYPLMACIPNDIKENDLELYANATDPNGPAMTQSMFAIGWLDVGNTANASAAFKKNFENVKGPFKVWSELKTGEGATNFITGAGGFLQAVIFGYGGLRLKAEGLYFKLQLPHDTTELNLNGVKYLGNSLQFHVSTAGCFVSLLESSSSAKQLYLRFEEKTMCLSRMHPVYICEGKIFRKKADIKVVSL